MLMRLLTILYRQHGLLQCISYVPRMSAVPNSAVECRIAEIQLRTIANSVQDTARIGMFGFINPAQSCQVDFRNGSIASRGGFLNFNAHARRRLLRDRRCGKQKGSDDR